MQTAIAAVITGATFVYDATLNGGDGGFLLTLDGADANSSPEVFAAHSAGTGTDISAALGMDADSSPVYAQGHDTETLSEALAEMVPQASRRSADAAYGRRVVPGRRERRRHARIARHLRAGRRLLRVHP